jgi:hypothetical protein
LLPFNGFIERERKLRHKEARSISDRRVDALAILKASLAYCPLAAGRLNAV